MEAAELRSMVSAIGTLLTHSGQCRACSLDMRVVAELSRLCVKAEAQAEQIEAGDKNLPKKE